MARRLDEIKNIVTGEYKGERVRVGLFGKEWTNVFIPSRQEEVSVRSEKVTNIRNRGRK